MTGAHTLVPCDLLQDTRLTLGARFLAMILMMDGGPRGAPELIVLTGEDYDRLVGRLRELRRAGLLRSTSDGETVRWWVEVEP